jgi:hypothetical protein
MKLRYIILIFLLVGAFFIVKYNNYNIENPDDRASFLKDYGKWLFGVGKSVKNVAGYAIKEQWLPEQNNLTNITTNASQKHDVLVIYK